MAGKQKKRTFAHDFKTQKSDGVVAQLVEQRTENPCVTGSTPVDATRKGSTNGFLFSHIETFNEEKDYSFFKIHISKFPTAMSLEQTINNDIKQAMLNKDKAVLESLRAIKSAILLLKTGKDAVNGEVSEAAEIAMLQKLVKQRKEAAEIFVQQNRKDLADVELFQASIIERYLPKQLSAEDVEARVRAIMEEVGASSMKDMGRVMGQASKALAGQADNKMVSEIVKRLLS